MPEANDFTSDPIPTFVEEVTGTPTGQQYIATPIAKPVAAAPTPTATNTDSGPAQAAAPAVPPRGEDADNIPQSGSLFGQQSQTQENNSTEGDALEGTKTLEHGHRVIEPLEHSNIGHTLPPMPTKDTQSLTELEVAVGSAHASTPQQAPDIDNYTGTTSQAGSIIEPEAPGPVIPPPTVEAPVVVTPVEAPAVPPTPPPPTVAPVVSKLDPLPQQTPGIINPSTAPPVPPPFVPSSTQPQFFEADGSKGNPFLNPKD
jgi:hypothetical protein